MAENLPITAFHERFRGETNEEKNTMLISRALTLLVVLSLSAGCDPTLKPNPIAKQFGTTTQTTERYHVLAERPFEIMLGWDGYVVALEKISKEIAYPVDSAKPGTAHPYDLLISQYDQQMKIENPKLVAHLADRFDDNKIMVVTHVLAYERQGVGVRYLYNVYDHGGLRQDVCTTADLKPQGPAVLDRPTDAGTYSPLLKTPLAKPPACGAHEDFFTRGIAVLQTTLKNELRERLRTGTYTHLVLASMGWDNDQVESVRRYSATLSVLAEAARRQGATFRPLVIGITWPSVWGWASWFDFGQLVYKLVGYGNKADDADEVGYTIFNYLLNGLARNVVMEAGQPNLPIVALGHSFGGRVVSRALFSDDLLRPDLKEGRRAPVTVFIGLQPAFSINRFIRDCPDRDGRHCGNEGSPYADIKKPDSGIVITTSEHDTANPIAWFLTQARHAGGWRGLVRAREHSSIFEFLDGDDPTAQLNNAATCQKLRRREHVAIVDAKSFVFNHNDVLDLEMGELMWSAIRCFTGERSS